MLFKILHGDKARISTDITPYHEGYCYVTHDGDFYVDMNNERVKLNAQDADTATKALQDGSGNIITDTYETMETGSLKREAHNTDRDAHADIREQIRQLSSEIANQNTRIQNAVETEFENEKGNMIQLLIDELQGLPVFGVVDDNNVITVTSILMDGTYVLKYEMEDGSFADIGTIIVGTGTGSGSGGDSGGDEPVTIVNLADPTSAEWKTNKRINSSKNEVDIPESSLGGETMVITNLIDITGATNSTKFHIKGLNLLATTGVGASYNRVYFYDETKTYKIYWQPSGSYVSNYVSVSDYDDNVQIFTNIQQLMSGISELSGVTVKYITFGAVLTGTAEDVVITKDTNIV